MNYRLVVLTHGPSLPVLSATLDAFFEHVSPAPSLVCLNGDGKEALAAINGYGRAHGPTLGTDWQIVGRSEAQGFCTATREAWNDAASGDQDFVFWLEHDFVIERDVDLTRFAAVLQAEPTLAQMALMRDAVNEQEKAAGGLYESRRDQYVRREHDSASDYSYKRPIAAGLLPHSLDSKVWLEHRAYLTTNPSLMRRAFMQHNPWPDHEAECEGRFGIDLVLRGYSFGVWGDGRPWCRHIGERTGFGY